METTTTYQEVSCYTKVGGWLMSHTPSEMNLQYTFGCGCYLWGPILWEDVDSEYMDDVCGGASPIIASLEEVLNEVVKEIHQYSESCWSKNNLSSEEGVNRLINLANKIRLLNVLKEKNYKGPIPSDMQVLEDLVSWMNKSKFNNPLASNKGLLKSNENKFIGIK